MAGIALSLRPLVPSPVQTHPTRHATRTHTNSTRIRTRNPLRPSSSASSSSSASQQNPNSPNGFKPEHESESPLPALLSRAGVDGISLEILYIALPAVLALAADPFASLVDTAFVGHFGSDELAAIGVSVSLINLVSKLFNIPLLNVTTSFVAEQQSWQNGTAGKKDFGILLEPTGGKKHLPAVSTSLALAAGIGIVEAITLSLGSGPLLNFMGIPVDSPMRLPAEQFLVLRAFGAPPVVIALAAQGAFRGFMDTKTPLFAVGAGNLLNAVLDPILIFFLGLGIGGAAIATLISEYLIAFILLWKLNERVILVPPNLFGSGVVRYLKSGGLLIGRTVAVLLTMTLATSMAAREGPVPMAGHQICLQVWLAVSLLNDALALAGQALLASEFTRGNYKQARLIVHRVLQIGAATGTAFAVLLFFGFEAFSTIFTTDSAVLNVARSGVLFVTASQPINAIAFVLDGLYYGVSDFAFAAYSMVFAGLVTSAFLLIASPVYGLAGVWTGLFLFMTLRAAAGFWRLGTKGGPWEKVWSESELGMTEE